MNMEAGRDSPGRRSGDQPGILPVGLLWGITTVLGVWYGFQYAVPQERLFDYFAVGTAAFFAGLAALLVAAWRSRGAQVHERTTAGVLLSAAAVLQGLYFFSKALPVSWIVVAAVVVVPALALVWWRAGLALAWVGVAGLLAYWAIALLEPLDVAAANMLPIIQAACVDVAAGVNPYTKTYPDIATLPLYYFPGLWVPYCPFEWLHLDVRWLNVSLDLLVVVLLARACGAPGRWDLFGACVLPFLLSPPLLQMLIHGHLWPYWTMIALVLYLLTRARIAAAASALAAGLGMRQLALFMVVPLSAAFLAGGPRTVIRRALLAAGVLAVLLLPAVAAVDSFVSHFFTSIANANATLNVHPGNPHDQIALSGLLPGGTRPALLQALQVLVAFAGFGAALWAGRGKPTPAALLIAGCAYLCAVGLNPFVNRYFYVPGIMVACVALAHGVRAGTR
jgi:hypothetical protein